MKHVQEFSQKITLIKTHVFSKCDETYRRNGMMQKQIENAFANHAKKKFSRWNWI